MSDIAGSTEVSRSDAQAAVEAVERVRSLTAEQVGKFVNALQIVPADRLDILAGYAGLPLHELVSPFQSLGLGTRLALDTAGVVRMRDDGRAAFAVEPLAAATDFLEAVVALQQIRDAQPELVEGALDDDELEKLWSDTFTVEPAKVPDGAVTVGGLRDVLRAIGVVHVPARIQQIGSGGKVMLRLLSAAGDALAGTPEVLWWEKGSGTNRQIGERVDVEFAVAVPKKRNPIFATKPTSFDATWAKIAKDAPISDGAAIKVRYEHVVKPLVSLDPGEKPNAVLTLLKVGGKTVTIQSAAPAEPAATARTAKKKPAKRASGATVVPNGSYARSTSTKVVGHTSKAAARKRKGS